jgi:hypothetical protein
LVSADAAPWIAGVVADRCKNAELCLDPFYSDFRIMPMSTRKCFRGNVLALVRSA